MPPSHGGISTTIGRRPAHLLHPPTISDSTRVIAEVWGALDLALSVDGTFGPTARVKPWLHLEVHPTLDPWWTLDSGVDIDGSLDLAIWGIPVAGLNTTLHRWPTGAWDAAPWMGTGPPTEGQDVRWSRVYDGPAVDGQPISIAVLPDGDILVSGEGEPGGRGSLLRLDPAGVPRWSKRFTDVTRGHWVVLPNGRSLVVGEREGLGMFIAEINEHGEMVWDRVHQPASVYSFDVHDAIVYTDGGQPRILMVATGQHGITQKMLLSSFDTAGNLLWSKAFTTPDAQSMIGKGAVQLPGGDLVIVGNLQGQLLPPRNDQNGLVMRITPQGTPVWARTIGTVFPDNLNGVSLTSDGQVRAVGERLRANTSEYDAVWTVEINADGTGLQQYQWAENVEWEAQFFGGAPNGDSQVGDHLWDSASAIIPVPEGYVIVGNTGFEEGREGWVIGLNDGVGRGGGTRLGGQEGDEFVAAATTTDGILLLGGTSSFNLAGPGTERDFWVSHMPWNGALHLSSARGGSSSFRSPLQRPVTGGQDVDSTSAISVADLIVTELVPVNDTEDALFVVIDVHAPR